MTSEPAVSGVILAAGSATRMGKTKQLVTLRGKPLLQHGIDAANCSRLEQVVVVLGYQSETIESVIDTGRASIAINEHFLDGQSTSIRAGLDALQPTWDGVLMLLGDQPGVAETTIDALINAFRDNPQSIFMPKYRGRPGNPVLFPCRYEGEMRAISGDEGARSIILRRSSQVRFVPIETDIPADIDTEADLQHLIE